jgi:hypothetical protein
MPRRPWIACSLLIAGFLVPAPAHAALTLQPGIRIESQGAQCTSNFVFEGTGNANRGKVYLGTAAHCVTKLGDAVTDDAREDFGKVAFIGDADSLARDFAFIEVLPGFAERLSPAVKGHPDLPRAGAASPEQTRPGDPIQISGFGLIFGVSPATEEGRTATLVEHDSSTYRVFGPLMQGDSGGPLVHLPTSRALGIVSRLCLGACAGIEGPTVQGILADAASHDFPVALRTVDGGGPAEPVAEPAVTRRTVVRRRASVGGRRVRLSLVFLRGAARLELERPSGGRWRIVSARKVVGFEPGETLLSVRARSGTRHGTATVVWRHAAGDVARRTYRFTAARLS